MLNDEPPRVDLWEKRFFECVTVRVWRRHDNTWSVAPWLFAIQKDGEGERSFYGVPNYCGTRHGAIMRAWYRAKWLARGEWRNHYQVSQNK